jgi:hypothetical protein
MPQQQPLRKLPQQQLDAYGGIEAGTSPGKTAVSIAAICFLKQAWFLRAK